MITKQCFILTRLPVNNPSYHLNVNGTSLDIQLKDWFPDLN